MRRRARHQTATGKWTWPILLLLLPSTLVLNAQSQRPEAALGGAEYEMSRHTIDGGGVMHSTGGEFELSGTIGQADAGTLTGGDFELTGGFWLALAVGDCNEDGGVNVFDHHTFAPCMNGPSPDLFDPDCVCFDTDRNNTVDLRDAAIFQNSINTAP